MAGQNIVNQKLAFGVEGDFYDDSPRIVDPFIVTSGRIGLYFTVQSADPTSAAPGGTGVMGGIAVNSKEYALLGTTASLEFRPGVAAQLASRGRVIVKATTAVTVGQAGFYNNTTGEIASADAGTALDGHTEIPNSKFVLVNALVGEVSVLQLN